MHRASDPSLTDKHQAQEQIRRRLTRRRKTQGQHHESGLQGKLNFKKTPKRRAAQRVGRSAPLSDYWRAAARTPQIFSIHKRGSQSDERLDPTRVEHEARRPPALLVESTPPSSHPGTLALPQGDIGRNLVILYHNNQRREKERA